MKFNKVVNYCFLKTKMTSSNVLYCQQPEVTQFIVIEEEISQIF